MASETELAALADALRNAAQASDAMAGSNRSAAAEQSRATQAAKDFGNAIGQTPAVLGRFAAGLARGNTEFTQFNGMIDLAANAAAGLARNIPILGGIFEGAIRAAAESSKFLTEQLNEVNNSFREFGRVGALGSQSMQGLVDQLNRSGLSLQSYRKLIIANSEALASMSGIVSAGADKFSSAVGELVADSSEAGMELRRLGFNADTMGEAAMAFISRETRLGRTQAMTAQELAAGTAKYAKELDMLSKLTGQSRETLQRSQDEAMADARYRATIFKLDRTTRDRLINFQSMFKDAGMRKALRDLMSGTAANSQQAQQMLAATGGAAQDIVNRLKSGAISESQAREELQQAYQGLGESVADIASQGVDTFGNFATSADFMNENIVGAADQASKAQDDQTKKTDELTENVIRASRAMELFAQGMNQLATQTLPYVAAVLKGTMDNIAGLMKKIPGLEGYVPPAWNQIGAGAAAPAAGGAANPPRPNTTPGGAASGMARPQAMAPGGADAFANINLRSQEAVAGGNVDPRLISWAEEIQRMYPGTQFTAFNDQYHQRNRPNSKHTQGLAVDFVVPGMTAGNRELGEQIVQQVRALGFANVQDRYNNFVSGLDTGYHFHAEAPGAARGGVLSGPSSGYAATLHGTEAVVPLPDGRSIPVQNIDSAGNEQQLDRLDTLITVMREQVGATKKLLQYAS